MGKLNIQQMTASAEGAMGWPYVSPGSNDSKGIDCSGLFVKCYRDQGATIAHGSNSIFHRYCSETAKLTDVSQLVPGMAVFKVSSWAPDDASNQWYGKEPGDVHHIGYVASVNPLRIIHASSAAGKVIEDTKLGKWTYCGRLSAVDYSGGAEPVPAPDPEPVVSKIVHAATGETVNLRKAPGGDLVDRVPVGETVMVYSDDGKWSSVRWKWKKGYMMSEFLVDSPDDSLVFYTVTIPHLARHHAEALVSNYDGATMTEEGRGLG